MVHKINFLIVVVLILALAAILKFFGVLALGDTDLLQSFRNHDFRILHPRISL